MGSEDFKIIVMCNGKRNSSFVTEIHADFTANKTKSEIMENHFNVIPEDMQKDPDCCHLWYRFEYPKWQRLQGTDMMKGLHGTLVLSNSALSDDVLKDEKPSPTGMNIKPKARN